MRRPNRDEQAVRARLAFEKYVWAADVGVRAGLQRDGDEQRRERKREPRPARAHRRTFRIARPACMPIHIIRHDVNAAMSMPRQNCAAFASR